MIQEVIVPYMGGAITTRPAGKFVEESTGREVIYDDAVVVSHGKKSVTLSIVQASALFDAIKNNPILREALGIKTGLLG